MPTNSQDKSFADEMQQSVDEVKMSNTSLDNAIAWMQGNLEPDDVFSEKKLIAWAESNGFIKE